MFGFICLVAVVVLKITAVENSVGREAEVAAMVKYVARSILLLHTVRSCYVI